MGIEDDGWEIEPGTVLRRTEVHAKFGGNRQSGIAPIANSPDVLVFTGKGGSRYGYDYDGWRLDGAFHYTGEGKVGDQKLTHGNKALAMTERKIRVFEEVQKAHVRYLGEFKTDEGDAWYTGTSRDVKENERTVIVFKLWPLDPSIAEKQKNGALPPPGRVRGDAVAVTSVEETVDEEGPEVAGPGKADLSSGDGHLRWTSDTTVEEDKHNRDGLAHRGELRNQNTSFGDIVADDTASVELIPIKSETRTIQKCFQYCLYDVPNFQREYSWTSDQLADFWNDVVLAQGDFFFGSTVTWISERRELFNDTYSIIDGQQRLTTSAIMLSVIRDAFQELATDSGRSAGSRAAEAQSIATQRYLVATDDDGNSYPVLNRSEPIFGEQIQHSNALRSGVKLNKSAENIRAAQQLLKSRVCAALEGLSLEAKVESLKSIRANVLKARVIQVELTSEEDGFLIFETLNTRGTDLRLADLVKNLLIRGGASSAQNRKTISTRWENLVRRVEDGRTNPDVDSFIWQSWNSRRDAVKQAELFKEVKNFVKSDPSLHLAYLDELEEDSQVYEWLENEDVQPERKVRGSRNPFSVPQFVDGLRALAIFNVTVANTTVLAIARKFQKCSYMKESHLIEAIRLVEKFHFQFSALTNSGSTGGTRGRYNWFAVRLEAAKSAEEIGSAIAEMKSRLRDSLPARDRAESAFAGLFYAPGLKLTQKQKVRARKVFVAYVLMAFASYRKLIPAGQNLTSWSIEHIKPQTLGSASCDDPVYSIGNLTLLTSALNSRLGASSLEGKIDELRKGNAYFDPILASWAQSGLDEPSESQIRERAALLAAEALDEVWAL